MEEKRTRSTAIERDNKARESRGGAMERNNVNFVSA